MNSLLEALGPKWNKTEVNLFICLYKRYKTNFKTIANKFNENNYNLRGIQRVQI